LRREERQTAAAVDKGHGRVERRTLTSTTALNAYLDWPGVGQVFRLVRERTAGGATTTEVAYGITSLTRAQADAGRSLALTRAHWGIENRLHYVRDETFGGDRCRVRTGAAPQLLAAVRNAAIYLLETVAAASKAAATRRFAARPHEALPLILT
jgi:Transposase DDE domain